MFQGPLRTSPHRVDKRYLYYIPTSSKIIVI